MEASNCASRPVGATTSTRSAAGLDPASGGTDARTLHLKKRRPLADVVRNTAQDTLEATQRLTHAHASVSDLKFTNRQLMAAASLLEHRDCLPHLPLGLEEAKDQQTVRQ